MHVFSYAKQKAGMENKCGEKLKQVLQDMKLNNRQYYL
jgi:hypothetical protein